MAVYRRRYQPQAQGGGPPGRRGLVFTRYAFRELFSQRLFSLYFALSFAGPLIGAVIIYLHFNPLGLKVLETSVREILPIDAEFFLRFLLVQTGLGSLLAAVIGPGLVAPDLANHALTLYLSRPVSRGQYILGKLAVLVGLLSALTWVPLLLLFLLQSFLAGWEWFTGNLHLAAGILLCSALWIVMVSLLTLAIAAWVRLRPVATLSVFGFFFISAALGNLIEETLNAGWGAFLNLPKLMRFLFSDFFGLYASPEAPGAAASFAALGLWCLVFLAMLRHRVRGLEVVRS